MPKSTFNALVLSALGWALIPKLALACATCGFNDDSNAYFLKMILFMTALPVTCLGAAVFYLRKKGTVEGELRSPAPSIEEGENL